MSGAPWLQCFASVRLSHGARETLQKQANAHVPAGSNLGRPQLSRAPVTASPVQQTVARNAIVMPRPPPGHHRLYNPRGQPLADVVIDPFLAVHLRPHQVCLGTAPTGLARAFGYDGNLSRLACVGRVCCPL